MQLRLNTDIRVTVVGLGYVGLTLATALAREGFVVHGIDSSDDQLEAIRQGKPRFFEPGLSEALSRHLERNLFVGSRHGSAIPDVCIIAVSTPVDTETGKPDLSHLRAASDALAPHIGPDTLVIVRSTVPVGTTRNVVLPRLVAESNDGKVQLAFCPERTIQGQALRELQSLPQLIGAIDRTSAEMARDFFGRIARQVVVLESPESAE
ncbi:MAG: nucleotide sugar dehydrogenase, partial [Planctomycetes bacterium]|nr:nucleotide sugar dehydrogenase [Planctomycetota bacterium]